MPITNHSPIHSFDVTYREAKRIQEELSARVVLSDTIESPGDIEFVGGADVAFLDVETESTVFSPAGQSREGEGEGSQGSGSDGAGCGSRTVALAAVVVIDVKRREVAHTAFASAPVRFPYVPGYLTFREGPAVLAAIGELNTLPGVMIYDGAGIAHPRLLGLASHMGVLTCIPSIGCAKSLLVGYYDEPGKIKGEWTYLYVNNRPVGVCLRTKTGVSPVFVSPGSGFGVDGARRFVDSLAWKFRLPEPTRIAHRMVTEEKMRLMRGV
jgi:deoxyribonuclease V